MTESWRKHKPGVNFEIRCPSEDRLVIASWPGLVVDDQMTLPLPSDNMPYCPCCGVQVNEQPIKLFVCQCSWSYRGMLNNGRQQSGKGEAGESICIIEHGLDNFESLTITATERSSGGGVASHWGNSNNKQRTVSDSSPLPRNVVFAQPVQMNNAIPCALCKNPFEADHTLIIMGKHFCFSCSAVVQAKIREREAAAQSQVGGGDSPQQFQQQAPQQSQALIGCSLCKLEFPQDRTYEIRERPFCMPCGKKLLSKIKDKTDGEYALEQRFVDLENNPAEERLHARRNPERKPSLVWEQKSDEEKSAMMRAREKERERELREQEAERERQQEAERVRRESDRRRELAAAERARLLQEEKEREMENELLAIEQAEEEEERERLERERLEREEKERNAPKCTACQQNTEKMFMIKETLFCALCSRVLLQKMKERGELERKLQEEKEAERQKQLEREAREREAALERERLRLEQEALEAERELERERLIAQMEAEIEEQERLQAEREERERLEAERERARVQAELEKEKAARKEKRKEKARREKAAREKREREKAEREEAARLAADKERQEREAEMERELAALAEKAEAEREAARQKLTEKVRQQKEEAQRKEAERKRLEEEERQRELERQAEQERLEELERQEEAERQAELERKERERKEEDAREEARKNEAKEAAKKEAEAKKIAMRLMQAAEREAEAKRKAEVERERQRREEEEARVERERRRREEEEERLAAQRQADEKAAKEREEAQKVNAEEMARKLLIDQLFSGLMDPAPSLPERSPRGVAESPRSERSANPFKQQAGQQAATSPLTTTKTSSSSALKNSSESGRRKIKKEATGEDIDREKPTRKTSRGHMAMTDNKVTRKLSTPHPSHLPPNSGAANPTSATQSPSGSRKSSSTKDSNTVSSATGSSGGGHTRSHSQASLNLPFLPTASLPTCPPSPSSPGLRTSLPSVPQVPSQASPLEKPHEEPEQKIEPVKKQPSIPPKPTPKTLPIVTPIMKEERAKEQPQIPTQNTSTSAGTNNASIDDIMAEIELAEQAALMKVSSRVGLKKKNSVSDNSHSISRSNASQDMELDLLLEESNRDLKSRAVTRKASSNLLERQQINANPNASAGLNSNPRSVAIPSASTPTASVSGASEFDAFEAEMIQFLSSKK